MDAPPATHPTDQTLYAYGLGKLEDFSADSIGKHIDSCPACRRRVAELSSDSFLDGLRDAQARPDPLSPVVSSLAGQSMMASGTDSSAPPRAETLPRGLADHTNYEVLCELGQGGMGVVYLARNKLMGRKEVLKIVSSHLINRPGVWDRFLAEIRNAAKLHHPNIVTAYSALQLCESLILAMEYVEGLDLAKMVKARGPLPVANAANYIHQAALGLQHAHEQGMVHRDIKPSNLMLARQGNRAVIKVLDFGLAKVGREVPADGMLTREGQMLGTPDFIAPEQSIDARKADIRADIYSLGCTLYYLLTGGPPFQETSLYDILQAHHSRDAQPLNLARPEVPVELAELVAKMMAKEPNRRFQAPGEVAKALTPFFKRAAKSAVASDLVIPPESTPTTGRSTSGSTSLTPTSTPAPAPVATPLAARNQSRPEEMWKSLIDSGEPDEIDVSLAAAGQTARKRRNWLWPALASVVGTIAMLSGAVVIYRIATDTGQLVIEAEDPNIEVVVKHGGKLVVIIDPQTRKEVELRSGRYELELPGHEPGLKLSSEHFTLKRGDRTIVTVRREPPAPGPNVASGSSSNSSSSTARREPPTPAPDSGSPALSMSSPASGEIPQRILSKHGTTVPPKDAGSSKVRNNSSAQPGLELLGGPSIDDFAEIARFQSPHDLPGGQVVFLPDSRRIVYTTGQDVQNNKWLPGTDPALWLGDVESPKTPLKFPIPGPPGSCSLALSRDGRLALTTSADRTLRLWDIANIETTTPRRVRREDADMDKVVFSPDERRAAYTIGDTIRLCDLKTGDELMTFRGHSGRIWGLAFYASGRRLVSGGWDDGTIRTWNAETGEEVRQSKADHVRSLAVFPDGPRVLASTWWTIGVWDLVTLQQLRRPHLADGNGCPVAVSPDGRRALFGRISNNDTLLWDLETSELLGNFVGHTGGVYGVAFSRDGRRAASVSFDKTVRVWALPPDRAPDVQPPIVAVADFLGHEGGIASKPAVSTDGRRILSGSIDKTMILWDRETAQPIRRFKGHEGIVWDVAFSPNGRRALSGGADKVLRLWDLESGELLRQLNGHADPIFVVAFSPDGRLAYSAGGGEERDGKQDGGDCAIHVWDLKMGREAARLRGHKGIVWGMALSPDGRRLLTAGDDKDVILWNLKSAGAIRHLKGHMAGAGSVAFLPDGRRAVSASRDRTIRLWDLESGQEVHCFRGHRSRVICVAVSPDGRWLLSSAYESNELLLWDLGARKLIHRHCSGSEGPNRGSFTPDGRHALWGGDRVIHMYRMSGTVQADRSASSAKSVHRRPAASRQLTRTASSTPR
jgi:WD40 repeat protein/serine/threonine protein kinase